MERFTVRYEDKEDGKAVAVKCGENVDTFLEGEPGYEAADKLAEYEDLEEAGLLVKLPCKVGDIVWDIDAGYLEPCKIAAFSYGCHDLVKFGCDDKITFYYTSCRRQLAGIFLLSELGKTVFLTREEAKEKLEELKQHD